MPCAGNVPIIVASGSYNQPSGSAPNGGSLAATTIFTPTADGIFRVSTYASVPLSNNGTVNSITSYTDENHTSSHSGPNASANNPMSDSWTFRALSGDNIQIATSASANPNPNACIYDLFWVVEQLA